MLVVTLSEPLCKAYADLVVWGCVDVLLPAWLTRHAMHYGGKYVSTALPSRQVQHPFRTNSPRSLLVDGTAL
jgi:hypothetical protein